MARRAWLTKPFFSLFDLDFCQSPTSDLPVTVSPRAPARIVHGSAMSDTTATTNISHRNVVPSDVGWQFVPQYYTFVNKEPERLHCFYTKRSTFIHGTEGEDGKPCHGQQASAPQNMRHAYTKPDRAGNPPKNHVHRLQGLQGFHPLGRCAELGGRRHHHPGHRRNVKSGRAMAQIRPDVLPRRAA